jgi:hypothetical protein
VNEKIDEVIEMLSRYDEPITVAAVMINLQDRVTVKEGDQARYDGIAWRVRRRLRQQGFNSVDSNTNEHKQLWNSDDVDMEGRVSVKSESIRHQMRHRDADRAVAEMLRAKKQELGRPVTAVEFESEVQSIYSDYGIEVAA